MARVPKDPDQRRRRNKPPEFATLPVGGYDGPYPPLPGAYRDGYDADGESVMREYLPETRRWYDVLARSPMATTFTDFDWLRAQQIAPLVDAYYRRPCERLASELRYQQALFGGSPADRLRLRVKIGEREDRPSDDAAPRRREDPRLRIVGE